MMNRFVKSWTRQWLWPAALVPLVLTWPGCESRPPAPLTVTHATVIAPGDSLSITMESDSANAPLKFTVSSNGTIYLALIGDMPVAGKTPSQVELQIHDVYVPAIYPALSVRVDFGLRYYYVSGQINYTNVGKIFYAGHTTVLSAIAAAGGFNPFAARKRVQLTRRDGKIIIVDCKKARNDPKLDLEVFPGDKVFVDQQTFFVGFISD